MNYTIINPNTGKPVSIYGKIGQVIIYNYIQNGGGNCELCGSPDADITSCPYHYQFASIAYEEVDYKKHYLATDERLWKDKVLQGKIKEKYGIDYPDEQLVYPTIKRKDIDEYNWNKKYHIPDFTKILSNQLNIIPIISELPKKVKSLSKMNVIPWLNNKPSGYFAICGHGYYNDTFDETEESEFIVPNGIRIVLLEDSGAVVSYGLTTMLHNRLFMEDSCLQESTDRSIVPAYLLSYQSEKKVNYDIHEVCKYLSDNYKNGMDCNACKVLDRYKKSGKSFNIYDSGSICSNLTIYWTSFIGSKQKQGLQKLGIYKLPNEELSSYKIIETDTIEELHEKNSSWEDSEAFRGSFMPHNVGLKIKNWNEERMEMDDLEEVNRIQRKYKEENDRVLEIDHLQENTIPSLDSMETDPIKLWDKYGNHTSSLHHIIYNLPRGTVENPMVYFVSSCRSTSDGLYPLIRQVSEMNDPLLYRYLSEVDE